MCELGGDVCSGENIVAGVWRGRLLRRFEWFDVLFLAIVLRISTVVGEAIASGAKIVANRDVIWVGCDGVAMVIVAGITTGVRK